MAEEGARVEAARSDLGLSVVLTAVGLVQGMDSVKGFSLE